MNSEQMPRRAVVLGAGMAGLLAARVLADHCTEVVLVEGDHLPTEPTSRPGVPQGRHVHVLLAQGTRTLENLIPGFGQDMVHHGGHSIDVGTDLLLNSIHGQGARSHCGLQTVGASRPLIESVTRERVLALPNVKLLTNHQADGLVGSPHRVTAVSLRDRATQASTELAADLVLDATGRASRLPTWLTTLGCPPVPETVIDAHAAYATRQFRLAPGTEPRDWTACYALASGPVMPRGGMFMQIEDGRWIATLWGLGPGNQPSGADDAFLPFAKSLATDLIADTLAEAESLGPVARTHATANRRRSYHRVKGLPHNVLALGDSACALNPIYGQGMTVAALSATLLKSRLTRDDPHAPGFAHRYHQHLTRVHRTAWLLATTSDLRYPHTTGTRATPVHRLLNAHIDHVLAVGTRGPRLHAAFLNVLSLVRHPMTLFAPAVLLRTVTQHAASTRRGTPHRARYAALPGGTMPSHRPRRQPEDGSIYDPHAD